VEDQGLVEDAASPAKPTILICILFLVVADGETDPTAVQRILPRLSETFLDDFHVFKYHDPATLMPSLRLIKEDLESRSLTPALHELLNLAFVGRVGKALEVNNRGLFEFHFAQWLIYVWFKGCVLYRSYLF